MRTSVGDLLESFGTGSVFGSLTPDESDASAAGIFTVSSGVGSASEPVSAGASMGVSSLSSVCSAASRPLVSGSTESWPGTGASFFSSSIGLVSIRSLA